MRPGNKSLKFQLAWRLTVLQAVILLASITVLTLSLFGASMTYIDEEVSHVVAGALVVDGDTMTIRDTEALRALKSRFPALWFAAVDERGHRLVQGSIPEAYRPLQAALPSMENSEIHTSRKPYELTMRVEARDTPFGRVHVMVGGAPLTAKKPLFLKIATYLVWRVGLPLALVTLIAVPWIIHRSMAGVGDVVGQAQAIDIDERGARLEDAAVPRELQPLVQAFNVALERLNEGYEARDRFLADAAHELRAPIAILEARLETLPMSEARTRLTTDLARLANIAEQLLDLQRLGRHVAEFVPLDLVELAREVTSDVAPLALDAGYDMAMDAPDTPVVVIGDWPSLSRALTNLIQNAIAHAGGRGLIHVVVAAGGVFEISDQGPGIPEDQRTRVFTPFYRLRPSSVGTGLGLHLVQEIVARHGGEIRVLDAPGGGARFRIHLREAEPSAPGGIPHSPTFTPV